MRAGILLTANVRVVVYIEEGSSVSRGTRRQLNAVRGPSDATFVGLDG